MQNLEVVGQGATTKIYRDGERAIKLYVGAALEDVEREARQQSFAVRAGLPVPDVYGVRRLDEAHIALEMAYIPGDPLLHPKMDAQQRQDALRTFVRLQCAFHAVGAEGMPNQAERLALRIRRSEHLSQAVKEDLLSQLRALDTHAQCLCHGDYHPLNVIHDGQKYWIIDWVDATAGNPLADACRTYVLFRQHLKRLAGIYLDLYCKAAGAARADVLAWLPVVAGARTDEPMDEAARSILMDMVGTGTAT